MEVLNTSSNLFTNNNNNLSIVGDSSSSCLLTLYNPLDKEMIDSPLASDSLKCGSCSTEFLLSDIVIFIQHKTKSCKFTNKSENKENLFKCSNCTETFNTARTLLEHAQFEHKIDIFIENTRLKSSTKTSALSSNVSAGNYLSSQNHLNSILVDSNGHINNKSNNNNTTTQNEIFIDVIPSDPSIDFTDKNQSYNIKVSSVSTSTSMASSSTNNTVNSSNNNSSSCSGNNLVNTNNNLNISSRKNNNSQSSYEYSDSSLSVSRKPKTIENLLKNNKIKENQQQLLIEHNENTSSSTDSNLTGKHDDSNNSCLSGANSNNASTSSEKLPIDISKSNSTDENNNDCKNNSNADDKRKKPKQTSFFCDVCQAAFNQKIHLTKHSAKHTGIKPFKCSECNYSTVERSHLKVHVRVHTGEKPFKCTFCEYATAQSSTLKIHKKRHHDKMDQTRANTSTDGSAITSKSDDSQVSQSLNEIEFRDKTVLMPAVESSLKNQVCKEGSSTGIINAEQEKRNFNLESIYKDLKNLPPTKRFKNYIENESKNCAQQFQPLPNEPIKPKIEPDEHDSNEKLKNSDNNLNSDEIIILSSDQASSSPSYDSYKSKTIDQKQQTKNKPINGACCSDPSGATIDQQANTTSNDNKLLGLANIALERANPGN